MRRGAATSPVGRALLVLQATLLLGASLLLVASVAGPARPAAAAPIAKTCSYGTGGVAASGLCWFDFTGYNDTEAASAAGQQVTQTIPGGYTATFTLRRTSTTGYPGVTAVAAPTWDWTAFGNPPAGYSGVAGRPALYANDIFTTPNSTGTWTISLTNVQVRDSAGTLMPNYRLVAADAESTNDGERITWTTNGGPWQTVATLPRIDSPPGTTCGTGATGIGTTTVVCSGNTTDDVGNLVVSSGSAPTSISAAVRQNVGNIPGYAGQQAIAFGIGTFKMELTKSVAQRARPADQFGLSITDTVSSQVVASGATTGTNTTATTGVRTSVSFDPFSMAESGVGATDLADYSNSWACSNATAGSTTVLPSGTGTSKSVTPQLADSVRCTITNQFVPRPAWTLAKTANPVTGSVVAPGSQISYTLSATNTSLVQVTGVVVADDLSNVLNNAAFGSITNSDGGTATRSGNALTWNVGTLAAGATRTVSYTVTVNASAHGVVLTNSASGTGSVAPAACTAAAPCVTTHSTPAPVPLSYAKSSNPAAGTAVKSGDTVTYTVTATNSTANPSISGLVTDDMAAVLARATLTSPPTLSCAPTASSCGSLAYTSGSTSFVWTSTAASPLAANTVATITYTVKVDAGATGTLHNVLVEPNIAVDHPIITTAKAVDVGANTQVDPGDTLTYTITVADTGAVATLPFSVFDDLTNVVNKADLVAGSIVVTPAGRGSASYDATTKHLTWTGSLLAGQSVSVSYQATVKADAFGQLKNAFVDKQVINPISASLRWRKTDGAGQVLSGARWTLTPVDGGGAPTGPAVAVIDCTAAPCLGQDTDPVGGQFLVVGLTPGTYRMVETKAPLGFVLDATPIAVVVASNTQVTVLPDVVNGQQRSPGLPFAGGIGSDHLKLAGAGLLCLSALLAGWQRKRRRLT